MLLAVYGIIVTMMLIDFYVEPYQSITGTLLNGETINWFSGEALLALSWFLVPLSFSAIAYRTIGNLRRTEEKDKAPGNSAVAH